MPGAAIHVPDVGYEHREEPEALVPRARPPMPPLTGRLTPTRPGSRSPRPSFLASWSSQRAAEATSTSPRSQESKGDPMAEDHRSGDEVVPLELYFDLVFVFAVSQRSHHLIDDLRGGVERRRSPASISEQTAPYADG